MFFCFAFCNIPTILDETVHAKIIVSHVKYSDFFILLTSSGKHDFMLNWRPVLMHNANVALMVADLLLGRLPVCANHLPLPLMWGAAYVLFAWVWHARTGVYYYPFLDHTLPWYKAVPMHVALLAGLSAFHFLGAFASHLAAGSDDDIAIVPFEYRAASGLAIVAMITKVRR